MKSRGAVDIIGLRESIDLPQYGIKSVPAKIDTGADFSSIWASDINLAGNELSFCLFGPGNAFYTGKPIKTKKFEGIAIKNSFGVAESRYKVRLMIRIGERNITGTFTLADRSNMSYPVLIGRKLLKGKFIVDVSQMELHSGKGSKRSILILASRPGAELKEFVSDLTATLKTEKTKIDIRSYDDLVYRFEKTGLRVLEMANNKDIGTYDLVYFKSHKNDQIRAVSAAKYLHSRRVKFIDKELDNFLSHDKLTQSIQLALYGLPVAESICASNEYLIKNANNLAKDWQWPMIFKEVAHDRGKHNYLVKNLKELKDRAAKAKPGEVYLLQKFIPNDGYIRIFVFGNNPSLAVFRTPHRNSNPLKGHLNNPQGSANAKLVDPKKLDNKVKDLAVRSAKVMNRQIAGVDLIKDKSDDSWYILEVNNAPQLRTGSFVPEKQKALARFIDDQINR